MAQTFETPANIERQLRYEFSYLFDIDEDEIQLDTRIVDMPGFDILDWQAMASIVVDKFGVTTSNEDFYSLQTVGDVLNYVNRQMK